MTAIAAFILPDAQATPVNHTFSPVTIINQMAKWADRSGGIAAGYPVVTHSLRDPTKSSKAYKAQTKIVLPVMEIVPPSTNLSKVKEILINVEFVIPESCTLQQRKDALKYLQGLTAAAFFVTCVQDLESVY